MSNRGRGGRGTDNRRDQPFPAASSRGRGDSSGRGRGGGRSGYSGGGRGPAPAPAPVSQTASSSTVPVRTAPSSSSSLSAGIQGMSLNAPAPTVAGKTLSSPAPASSMSSRPPARPGFGTAGRKCVVRANHFMVQVADRDIHHYDVTITPEVTSKKINREVIAKLTEVYRESHLNSKTPAYDGRKSIYTAGELPFKTKEFVVKLDDKDPNAKKTKRDREFRVTINFAARPDLFALQEFLRGRHKDAPQETIQVLDIVLRASPSNKYAVVGRSFFHPGLGIPGENRELGSGIEFWRGYYQSLRPTQMGLSLNIDISARSFYESLLVHDFISKYLGLRDFTRPFSDQDRMKVRKALRGVRVTVNHTGYLKSFKITGISSQPISQLMFTHDNVSKSVAKYFNEKYGIRLDYPFLPALQAGTDARPNYFPMEISMIAEGQRYTKKLNDRQVTAMLKATCQRPHQREKSIKEMVNRNDYNSDKLVNNEFGIEVQSQLTSVNARVLPTPMLKYHETGRERQVNPSFGAWNMINKKMYSGSKVEYWTCVNFSTRVERHVPHEFCMELVNMCNSKGMDISTNPLIPIHSASPHYIERVLRDVHRGCTEEFQRRGLGGKQLQLLIIILPDFTGSYGKIKRVCETELGIVSQCCQPKQASKLNKQYMENVSLKINVKVGGCNTVLNDAVMRRIPLISEQPTIIFGADVTHPQPGEDSSHSIAAVVASMDWPEITKYRGIVSAQPHREEIIQDLYTTSGDPQKGVVHGGIIREQLRAFRRSTGHIPARIIFYRDGVSEGQFSQVLLYEITAIRKACASLQDGYAPRITFVVVQKRHHTRLFPENYEARNQMDRSGNILPGTVVDSGICHPTEFDFYLNSHAGIQGTSRPTHYHVLYDENGFSADLMQMFTNNLCYTYARCTRSVSIVPPAYYAHHLAFRAKNYMDDASEAGSSGGGGVVIRDLPAIKENVKDVMFYC